MEKMPGHPRLYRRGAVYYHRAAIPVDIADSYPKAEETFSLKTTDYREAVRLVRVAAALVDQRFDEHRRRKQGDEIAGNAPVDLSDRQIEDIATRYLAVFLEQDEEMRLGGLTRDQYQRIENGIDAVESQLREDYAMGRTTPLVLGMLDQLLSDEYPTIQVDRTSHSWARLTWRVQAAHLRLLEAIKERQRGVETEIPSAPQHSPHAKSMSVGVGPHLSQALRDWITEKSRTSWVDKTKHEHEVWTGHFLEITRDRPISTYGKADGRAFKAVLLKLPANWNKFDALGKLPIDQAAERAAELGMPPMSDRNVNKLLGFVGSFWRWAEQHYDECPPNPFRGLNIAIKRAAREERDPFTVKELRAMFAAPIYTGCKSLSHWKEPGPLIPRDAGIFWVPLISLFTGARAGEVIQLYVEDFRQDDGICYLDINRDGEDKRLKNASSRRRIPVQEALVGMGLLEHVQARRRQGERRLFPDLELGADGYYSSPFSKHFSRFLDSVGIKRRNNAFHSFRHSFEDACRNSGIPSEVMDALQGHSQQGMKGRYGSGYSLKVLAAEMAKLRYDGLDLAHLRRSRVF